jgi:hypothetical protein
MLWAECERNPCVVPPMKKPPTKGAGGILEVGAELSAYGAEHPAANLPRKQEKSWTLRTGGMVLPSQLA